MLIYFKLQTKQSVQVVLNDSLDMILTDTCARYNTCCIKKAEK